MYLGDYIGDTRTDSLPPGFLKSIKIKYRHERSRVFAGLQPWQDDTAKVRESATAGSSESKAGSKVEKKEESIQSEEKNEPVSYKGSPRG